MKIKNFFDTKTSTFTYVIIDEQSKACAVIDPVLDLDLAASTVSTESINLVSHFLNENNLTLEWILETHIHADHLSGASLLKQRFGGQIGIGVGVIDVYKQWNPNFKGEIPSPTNCFDRLFKEGDNFSIGELIVNVIETPGHTPACVSYYINDSIFVGDTLFMPHLGTARVDFPGGSAKLLFNSIQKIFSLPDDTRVFVGHDYPKAGSKASCETPLSGQKEKNMMLNASTSLEDYITKREARDKTLGLPKLITPALQINLRAGQLVNELYTENSENKVTLTLVD